MASKKEKIPTFTIITFAVLGLICLYQSTFQKLPPEKTLKVITGVVSQLDKRHHGRGSAYTIIITLRDNKQKFGYYVLDNWHCTDTYEWLESLKEQEILLKYDMHSTKPLFGEPYFSIYELKHNNSICSYNELKGMYARNNVIGIFGGAVLLLIAMFCWLRNRN